MRDTRLDYGYEEIHSNHPSQSKTCKSVFKGQRADTLLWSGGGSLASSALALLLSDFVGFGTIETPLLN